MKKQEYKGYVILGILFIVFSVISFAIPFGKTPVFILAYIFGVVSIGFQIYVFKIAFTSGGNAKSKYYGFPIVKVGVMYLMIQLLISFIEMATSSVMPIWIVVVINILLLSAALIGCIAADVVRTEIEHQDVQIKKDTTNIINLRNISENLVALCNDEECKIRLKKLSEEFKYSDPVSSDNTFLLEEKLENQLINLKGMLQKEEYISSKTLCDEIMVNLKERNRICKMTK